MQEHFLLKVRITPVVKRVAEELKTADLKEAWKFVLQIVEKGDQFLLKQLDAESFPTSDVLRLVAEIRQTGRQRYELALFGGEL